MNGQDVWEAIKPNVKEVLVVIAEKLILQAIDELVKQTDNKFDDGLWPVLKPALMAEINNQISKI